MTGTWLTPGRAGRAVTHRPGDLPGVTWNVHHGTSEKQLRADLIRVIKVHLHKRGVRPAFFLLQEFKPNNGHSLVFRQAGYALWYYSPEFAIAVDVDRFRPVEIVEWEGVHDYWAEPRALTAVLWDKAAGFEVEFTTVHPPAHVQRKDHGKWPNIWKALSETDRMWDRRAREAAQVGRASVCGGDENVDLERGWFPRFFRRLVRGAAKVVDAPAPTHHRRTIDRFRINRLLKVVRGSLFVIGGLTSDHNAFACTFRYRRRRPRRALNRA